MIAMHLNNKGIFSVPMCYSVIIKICLSLFFIGVQLTDASGASLSSEKFRKQPVGRYEFTIPDKFNAISSSYKINDIEVREVPLADAGADYNEVWKKEILKIKSEKKGADEWRAVILQQGQMGDGVWFVIYHPPLGKEKSFIRLKALLKTRGTYLFFDIEDLTENTSKEDLKKRTNAVISAYRQHTGRSIPGKDFFYTGYGYIGLPNAKNQDEHVDISFSTSDENYLTMYMAKAMAVKMEKPPLFSRMLKTAARMWPDAPSELKGMKIIRERKRTVCGVKGGETVAYNPNIISKERSGNSFFRFKNPEEYSQLSIEMTVNSTSQSDFEAWLKVWDVVLDSVHTASSN